MSITACPKIKSDVEIAKELAEIPNTTGPVKKVESNFICNCGRKIGKDDIYFIMIQPQEKPEIFCEFCIEINA